MARKKAEAHHGGAWKVAYADFVTAMMALFMVLWICAQDKKILLATSRYFKQPFNAMTDKSVGILIGKDGGSVGKDKSEDHSTAANLNFLNALASELSRMLSVHDTMEEKTADLAVSSDGLKVTLFDRPKHPLFNKGSAEITEFGRLTLQNMAWIIERNSLNVYIDGHASREDAAKARPDYGPWELTTDRANAARRLLEKYAVEPAKFERVTGFGSTQPLPAHEADDQANDRIVLSLATTRR